jgi:hypothetical protein
MPKIYNQFYVGFLLTIFLNQYKKFSLWWDRTLCCLSLKRDFFHYIMGGELFSRIEIHAVFWQKLEEIRNFKNETRRSTQLNVRVKRGIYCQNAKESHGRVISVPGLHL